MNDFNSWEEVAECLSDTDKLDFINVGRYAFFGKCMTCDEGCCSENYHSVEEAIETIKYYCNEDITRLWRD